MIAEDTHPDSPPVGGPAPHPESGRRVLVPRRRLPAGRAVVGGLLIAVAAVGAIALASSGSESTEVAVVVADRPIRPGDPLGSQVLRVDQLALPDALVDTTYASPADLEGTVARSTMAPGELVQRGDVIESTAEQRAAAPAREFTLHLEADRIGGEHLEHGDRADVIATYGSGADAFTVVVLADVPVLGSRSTDDALGSTRGVTLTLSLDSRADTVTLAHAADVAQLRIIRTTTSEPDDEPLESYRATAEELEGER